jgi:hypothetical protein
VSQTEWGNINKLNNKFVTVTANRASASNSAAEVINATLAVKVTLVDGTEAALPSATANVTGRPSAIELRTMPTNVNIF